MEPQRFGRFGCPFQSSKRWFLSSMLVFRGFAAWQMKSADESPDRKSRIKHPNQLSIDIVEARLEEF